MKIFRSEQIREIDSYTIKNEPIASIDLMERAAIVLQDWIVNKFPEKKPVIIFAGPGNNGGDGLALARLLHGQGYPVTVYIAKISAKFSPDFSVNLDRLKEIKAIPVHVIEKSEDFPVIPKKSLIVDALLGSGLTRPLEGLAADIVWKINQKDRSCKVIAVDIPSGLFGEDNAQNYPNYIVKAKYTLSFQFPKLAFFFGENEPYVGTWEVLPIGLHPEAIKYEATSYFYFTCDCIKRLPKKRKKFSHKGTYGHALLISGCYGRMGAAVLASKACLRSGAGLLTTHVPRFGYPIIQTALPEAMVSIDQSDILFTEVPDLSAYSAVGIGPGIGTKCNSHRAMKALIQQVTVPMVIDADGINLLATEPELLEKLPENTILTPHPKEFERIAGETGDHYARMQKQLELSRKYNIIIVLKGAHTAISVPNGNMYFNTTGNPGMATAGSGDVLTGIILSLLAQNYTPEDAAKLGVYLHGKAGDLAKEKFGEEAMIASDISEHIGAAFLKIRAELTY